MGDLRNSGIQGTLAPHCMVRECFGSVLLTPDDISEIFLFQIRLSRIGSAIYNRKITKNNPIHSHHEHFSAKIT